MLGLDEMYFYSKSILYIKKNDNFIEIISFLYFVKENNILYFF